MEDKRQNIGSPLQGGMDYKRQNITSPLQGGMDCEMQNKMFYYFLHCLQAVNTYNSSWGFIFYTNLSTYEKRGLSGRVLDRRPKGRRV